MIFCQGLTANLWVMILHDHGAYREEKTSVSCCIAEVYRIPWQAAFAQGKKSSAGMGFFHS